MVGKRILNDDKYKKDNDIFLYVFSRLQFCLAFLLSNYIYIRYNIHVSPYITVKQQVHTAPFTCPFHKELEYKRNYYQYVHILSM